MKKFFNTMPKRTTKFFSNLLDKTKKLASGKDKNFWISISLWVSTFVALIIFVALTAAFNNHKSSGHALTIGIVGLIFILLLLSSLFFIVGMKFYERKNKSQGGSK